MTTHKKAYMAALLYTLIIGFSFMFVKIALTEASPLDTLAHRFTIAFVFATIPILLKKVKIKITMKSILPILPLALLYPTLFFTFQVFGLVYTTSSEAGIIQSTIPIFTLILATIFLKEQSSIWQKFFIFLSVAGVIYIFTMNGLNVEAYSFKGAMLILLSALSSSCYNVLARKLTKRYSLFTLTYVITFFGFISFNSIAITNHLIDKSLTHFFSPFLSLEFVGAVLYLGVLSSLCTSFLSNYALSKIEASKMSVFSNLATLVTILAGVIFLNETLQYYHLIGATVILVGVIGTNLLGQKQPKAN
ncbi:DMT family transporter [Bacillus sp. FJAT-42315]|uniref:DMT family transporter n=1 Tax=Bacillus sp. FJAT-42315 TaxID=2014077 RepID=UPI000C23FA8C|nr:DMT family transporter [Bacillus sp. FJAT-42315]